MEMRFLREGENVLVRLLIHDNIYLSSNSVIHTIKYGGRSQADCFLKVLDELTKKPFDKELLELSKGNN